MTPYVSCASKRKDCFANNSGKCTCLKDTVFPQNTCTFYKSNESLSMTKILQEIQEYVESHQETLGAIDADDPLIFD